MNDNNELARYMKDVNKHPILTREQELVLTKRMKQGDEQARQTVIVSNLRFVVQVANKFKTYTVNGKYSLLDLVQEGNKGLIRATERYNPASGNRFITYAVWWIRANILSFLIANHAMVKFGTTNLERKLFFKLGPIAEILNTSDLVQRDRMREALAIECKVPVKSIEKMEARLSWNETSLEKPMIDDPKLTLREGLRSKRDDEEFNTHKEMINRLKDRFDELMSGFSEREKDIIHTRWLSEDNLTLQKIGTKYGISRERVRQIESKLFNKMRLSLENTEFTTNILGEDHDSR